MGKASYFPSVKDIEKAAGILEEILEPTPLQFNHRLSASYDAEIFLKRD